MSTTLTYRVTQDDDGYVAKCEELPVESSGSSHEGALEALRKAITQHLGSVEAVAPPSHLPPPPRFELRPAREDDVEPQGPGDSPAAD
jgi:hypothetical protein